MAKHTHKNLGEQLEKAGKKKRKKSLAAISLNMDYLQLGMLTNSEGKRNLFRKSTSAVKSSFDLKLLCSMLS